MNQSFFKPTFCSFKHFYRDCENSAYNFRVHIHSNYHSDLLQEMRKSKAKSLCHTNSGHVAPPCFRCGIFPAVRDSYPPFVVMGIMTQQASYMTLGTREAFPKCAHSPKAVSRALPPHRPRIINEALMSFLTYVTAPAAPVVSYNLLKLNVRLLVYCSCVGVMFMSNAKEIV